MERDRLQALFNGSLCQNCMTVSEGWDTLGEYPVPCPKCGESAFGVEWPPEPASLLFRQAFSLGDGAEAPSDMPPEPPQISTLGEFHAQGFDDRKDGRDVEAQEEVERAAVQALLVVTALDVTLEWVFKAAVESLDPDSLEVARLVEPRQESALTTQERVDVLCDVAGVKLREVSDAVDEPQFPGWWKELDSERDRFLHGGDILAFHGIKEDELLEVSRMGIKVLATLNNTLW